jgi:predicted nucleic acid-binding protein
MMFWDSSAIIPLCIDEPQTKAVHQLVKKDHAIAVWWGSVIECYSAFARLRREGFLKSEEEDSIRHLLSLLSDTWTEIAPSEDVRDIAGRLLMLHPLHAADAMQLSAALVWAGKRPKDHQFVCFDLRLRDAARKEGFSLLPAQI